MPILDVDEGAVHGVFVRHIPHNADSFYQPPDPPDGRWQHGSVIAARRMCFAHGAGASAWRRERRGIRR
ncbi:hypothetical protein [Rathayibacter soli]|uniref:hypothetical protein n=1 Tax=Rathayibacter soli TaxID=3144168 RepID=UPI0027E5A4EE|nr:hypothetical protein [Glaciibacter superstes]